MTCKMCYGTRKIIQRSLDYVTVIACELCKDQPEEKIRLPKKRGRPKKITDQSPVISKRYGD